MSCNISPGLAGTGLGEACGLLQPRSSASLLTPVLKTAVDVKSSFIWGFTPEWSDQLFFVTRAAYSNNSWEFMT